jgi:hypothetical protein
MVAMFAATSGDVGRERPGTFGHNRLGTFTRRLGTFRRAKHADPA